MSGQPLPANLPLERMNRLSRSGANVTEGQNGHVRRLLAMMQWLGVVETRLSGVERELASLAAEQAALGARVEEAFPRAAQVGIRLDEQEDRATTGGPWALRGLHEKNKRVRGRARGEVRQGFGPRRLAGTTLAVR